MPPIKKKRAARKTESLRAELWLDLDPELLWDVDSHDGYTPVPRTMPIINDLTKGKPAGPAFLEFWCRAYKQMYVLLGAAAALATHSGYTGPKAVRNWQERIEQLEALGFIRTARGSAGRFSHAVILNPHKVIRSLYESGNVGVTPDKYDALKERANEIGSEDFKPVAAAPGAAVAAAP